MGTAVALGNFDGVHKAHEKLLRDMLFYAKEKNIKSLAYVFSPHPKALLVPCTMPGLLMTEEMRKRRILEIGVDKVWEEKRGMEILSLSPEEFFNTILVGELHAEFVTAGFNYRFGKGAKGDAALLEKLCRDAGIVCRILGPMETDGTPISSTRLRALLAEGRIEDVNAQSFAPYTLSGVVQRGKRLGKTLGFPTMNIEIPKALLLPKRGVYASFVNIDGTIYRGITNIGQNPTVETAVPRAETYIFDFDGDLYGKHADVTLLTFVRPERKFPDTDALSAQIQKDTAQIKLYFERKEPHGKNTPENTL